MTFRFAEEKDCALLLSLIKELAAYEKMEGAVALDEWTTYRLTGETLEKMAGVNK